MKLMTNKGLFTRCVVEIKEDAIVFSKTVPFYKDIMAARTPTTAQPRPLYRSVLAPALEELEEEDADDEELDAVLLLELVLAKEEELLLLPPLTASQISETTLLVAGSGRESELVYGSSLIDFSPVPPPFYLVQ